ncbi:MAG: DUF4136 domain-containing protein [Psychroserpens sp.]|nr:DUF4136 domain-containing protein [Psychroserpens sp.]
MKYFPVLLLVCLLFSCGSIRVNYDYEKTTDFDQYKTYNYYANLETGLSQLDEKRLLDVLDEVMASKGYTLSKEPDFFVDIKTSEYMEPSRSNVGVGIGGTGGNVGGGVSIGIPVGQNNYNRQILFEFIDEKKTELFWQAVADSNFSPNASPEKREALFRSIVTKVMEGYPPGPN